MVDKIYGKRAKGELQFSLGGLKNGNGPKNKVEFGKVSIQVCSTKNKRCTHFGVINMISKCRMIVFATQTLICNKPDWQGTSHLNTSSTTT